MNSQKTFLSNYSRHLGGDLSGGITAAITSLPLALAFGVASGAGPIAGLYGTICVGFFASLFGGAPTQISGPNSAMTAIVTYIISRYSSEPSLAFTVIMLAGLIQIAFGYLRVGKYLSLIPTPVISGFISGIGIYIAAMQIGRLFGHKTLSSPLEAIMALPVYISSINYDAFITGLLAMATIWFWPKKIARILPAPIVALIICTTVAELWLGGAPRVQSVPSALPQFVTPQIYFYLLPEMLESALTIASIGSIYSLLAALMADNILKTQHDSNRELIGQGVGNLVSGLCGGLAGNGAPVRTLINVKAGARTRLSGMFSAIILLIIVLCFSKYAAMVPIALLAGILIKTGFDIIDWNYLKRWSATLPFEKILCITMIGFTVFSNLITALMIGVVASSIWLILCLQDYQTRSIVKINAKNIADTLEDLREEPKKIDKQKEEIINLLHQNPNRDDIVVIKVNSFLTYTCANDISALNKLDQKIMIIDFSYCPMIDTTIALLISQLGKNRRSHEQITWFTGLNQDQGAFLTKLNVINEIDGNFTDIAEALHALPEHDKLQKTRKLA